MKDLLRWEMKQTLRSKAFWGMLIAFVGCIFLFILYPLLKGEGSGYDLYLETMDNLNGFIIFLTGIYAGIHITKAFENRNIQAAVMAGNSRFAVIVAKLISYVFSIAAFSVAALSVNGLIGFAACGLGEASGDFWIPVVVRGLVFVLVEIAFSSICVIISMFIKNMGGAIAVNLLTLLALNITTSILIAQDILTGLIPYTPAGQTFLLFADTTPHNLMVATVSSIVFLFIVLGVCFLRFRKAELK